MTTKLCKGKLYQAQPKPSHDFDAIPFFQDKAFILLCWIPSNSMLIFLESNEQGRSRVIYRDCIGWIKANLIEAVEANPEKES